MDLVRGVWRFFRRRRVYERIAPTGKIDLKKEAPNLDLFLWGPVLFTPQLCQLRELQDGTYNINDLMDMHEAMKLMNKVREKCQE